MAKSIDLQFRIPDNMEQRDSEVLTYIVKHFRSVIIDYEIGRIKVTVSTRSADRVKKRASKTNLQIEE